MPYGLSLVSPYLRFKYACLLFSFISFIILRMYRTVAFAELVWLGSLLQSIFDCGCFTVLLDSTHLNVLKLARIKH